MAELVMELAGVTKEVAEEALAKHKEVWLAVDALLEKPVVAGDKYIPPKPIVNTGLTLEQEERCKKGRWLQDQVNAVFSVAHSKTRTQPDVAQAQALAHDRAPSPSLELMPEVELPGLLPGFGGKNPPLVRQFESLR